MEQIKTAYLAVYHIFNNYKNNVFMSIFGTIEDSRNHINQLHNLIDILLIGIISVISGAETWKQMVEFARSKEDFLRRFLELPNGIPSEDTINRVFSSIDSSQFENSNIYEFTAPLDSVFEQAIPTTFIGLYCTHGCSWSEKIYPSPRICL